MTHPSFTISASGLRRLLSAVTPFADKGDSLPVLGAVLLRGHGNYVTALATDRYRLGIQRAKVDAPDTLHAIVPLTTVRQVLAIFKPGRRHDPDVTLTFEPSKVTVNTSGGMELLDARISFPLLDAEYPKALSIIRKAAEAPIVGDAVAFNPEFLGDFRHVATVTEPMVLRPGGPSAPTYVAIGDDFRGVIMPVRSVGGDDPSMGIGGDWAALVADAAEKKPAAKRAASKKAVA